MDIFGIGPLELLLILVIFLVVLGPEKIPDFGRRFGRAVRAFRSTTTELSRQMERELNIEQATEAPQERNVKKEVNGTTPAADKQNDGPKG